MLVYEDAPRAIEFLCEAFGFEERFRLPMPDGRIGHAELAHRGGVIALASEYPEIGLASPRRLEHLHAQLLVYVDDVDAHYERAKAAGAVVAAAPENQDYGDRSYRAVDPEGTRWIFATPISDR
jgi:PhnB protein